MNGSHFWGAGRVLTIMAAAMLPAAVAKADPKDLKAELTNLKPSSADVTISQSEDPAAPGTIVTIQPGNEGYPGASITAPAGKPWDLSNYGHVEARITNLGEKPVSVALRVDNAGKWQDNPWNTESVGIKPGATETLKVIFGYAYGKKKNYPLDPKGIVNFLFFTTKAKDTEKFRIETFQADGPAGETPPVDPNSIRLRLKDGVLLGKGSTLEAQQITEKNAKATLSGDKAQTLGISFPPGPVGEKEQYIAIKPVAGRWNMNDSLQLTLKVKNTGQVPVTPRAKVNSNGGNSEWVSTSAPLAPGASADIVVPFVSSEVTNIADKKSGNKVTSNTISTVAIAVDKDSTDRAIEVQSIVAGNPPLNLPVWLGKKPPVDGDWVQTLNENFDGPQLDATIWNNTGPNYWDKASHWSKENLIMKDGKAILRYERKTGPHNDEPGGKVTNYQGGYLDSYGKWTQRYGYFESRMKLPLAPGLWPAFWMMPDRGAGFAPEQWKRANTANGGMEFDIMESLTRWGPARYNIAVHYDGYGKEHKAKGSDVIYAQPDKDGYITSGMLWLPGSVVFYANGKEVARWDDERVSNVTSNFLFTIPQGGWDNDPVDDAQLPGDFLVDYVRVWQRKDLAIPTDGKQVQPVTAVAPAP